MTTAGEVSWPPAGSFLAAYGEVLMAADTGCVDGDRRRPTPHCLHPSRASRHPPGGPTIPATRPVSDNGSRAATEDDRAQSYPRPA
jgi:hypothetical protein